MGICWISKNHPHILSKEMLENHLAHILVMLQALGPLSAVLPAVEQHLSREREVRANRQESVYLRIYWDLSIYLSICSFIYSSIYLFIYSFIHPYVIVCVWANNTHIHVGQGSIHRYVSRHRSVTHHKLMCGEKTDAD